MIDNYKEVRFDLYCKKCKHCNKKEDEEPCDECLSNPVNLYSHKPINFEEKGNENNWEIKTDIQH